MFVEMICYKSVGGGMWILVESGKWKGLVVGDISWCVLMPMAV